MIEFLPVSEIESMAKARGLSIAQVCRLANVNQSTFQRWKDGAVPQVPTYNKVIAVIESASPATEAAA